MYYEGHNDHGLEFNPFKAIISPRPIGWISTVDKQGRPNLAPYSFFNAIASNPPILAFASESMKDSALNARDSGEFVFSLATVPLQGEMNASSDTIAHGESEFELAGLEAAPSRRVAPPRVAASPAAMECKTLTCQELVDLDGKPIGTWLITGQVVAVHIRDEYIRNGRFDTAAAQPLARCGYRDYAAVTEVFEIMRPTDGDAYDGVDR
ncbi:MAG: flavin reductase family protein [Burkholderiaceae bacterium]